MTSRLPLTFEKGVLESVESSMVPLGFATKLENWEPEPSGNLRCRTGWISASTTGAPATRKARGIGRYQSASAWRTPTVVQSAKNSTSSGTSIAATWGAATTTGNLLIAVFAYSAGNTGISVPAGWTLIPGADNGTDVGVRIYYKANATSESGSVTFSKTAAGALHLYLFEYSGLIASPLDKSAATTSTSTTASSGTTAATTQTVELWFAVLGSSSGSLSAPTNGFSQLDTIAPAGTKSLVLTKVAAATGAANTTATVSASNPWAGTIATFKAEATASSSASTGFFLVAQQETTGHGIYVLNASQLASGAWSLIETVAHAGPSWPVSFATGLRVVLYTNPFFSTLRRYDGASAAAVAGSPAGRVIAFHKNRFFVGGTDAHPSRLWFSQLGDYSLWWKSDKGETSLTDSSNYIDIDVDDGDSIEDIVPFEDGLLIAKGGSIHFLSGTGPDTFNRQRFNTGAGAAGRCICPTPYGAVIAAANQVGLWAGGGVDNISKPVESSYALTGDFVSTAYLDGVARIADEGTGTTFCLNMLTGAWWTEKVDNANEAPAVVYAHDNKLLMGPQAATSGSLLSYRSIAGARQRDHGTLSETFKVWTGEVWLKGVGVSVTPTAIFLRYRQRGTGSATVTLTPYYRDDNGTLNVGTASSLTVQASAGVYHAQVPVASDAVGKGVRAFQWRAEITVPSGSAALIELEECVLEYDTDRDR